MKTTAIAFTAPEQVQLLESDVPGLGPHDVLIATEHSMVSAGTERHFLLQPPRSPFFPGYSVAGTVTAIGADVTRHEIGDRVVASCRHATVVSCHEDYAVSIPAEVGGDVASFFNLGVVSQYFVRRARIALGDPVAVFGQGAIGLIVSQLARLAGGLPVVGFDIAPDRLSLSSADIRIDPRDEEAVSEVVSSLPGGGFAAAIEVTAVPSSLDMAMDTVRDRGRIVLGSVPNGTYLPDVYGRAWNKSLDLYCAQLVAQPWVLSQRQLQPFEYGLKLGETQPFDSPSSLDISIRQEIELFLRLLSAGRIDVSEYITQRVSVDDAVTCFEDLLDPARSELGTVIDWRA